jgi:hypothetical protein
MSDPQARLQWENLNDKGSTYVKTYGQMIGAEMEIGKSASGPWDTFMGTMGNAFGAMSEPFTKPAMAIANSISRATERWDSSMRQSNSGVAFAAISPYVTAYAKDVSRKDLERAILIDDVNRKKVRDEILNESITLPDVTGWVHKYINRQILENAAFMEAGDNIAESYGGHQNEIKGKDWETYHKNGGSISSETMFNYVKNNTEAQFKQKRRDIEFYLGHDTQGMARDVNIRISEEHQKRTIYGALEEFKGVNAEEINKIKVGAFDLDLKNMWSNTRGRTNEEKMEVYNTLQKAFVQGEGEGTKTLTRAGLTGAIRLDEFFKSDIKDINQGKAAILASGSMRGNEMLTSSLKGIESVYSTKLAQGERIDLMKSEASHIMNEMTVKDKDGKATILKDMSEKDTQSYNAALNTMIAESMKKLTSCIHGDRLRTYQ